MDARDLRVSDAEREHVGTLLQRAVGQGMLSLGEFSERMDTALAARTRGELNAVLADLPGIRIVDPQQHVPPQQPGYAPPAPGPDHIDRHSARPDVLRGWCSSLSRKGSWHVPPSLHVHGRMSGVVLDFTQAVLSTRTVEITLDCAFSSVTLILPEGATVDLNSIRLFASDVTSKVRSGPPTGRLHLVVRGHVRFGSVTAKHPFGTTWRRMIGGHDSGWH